MLLNRLKMNMVQESVESIQHNVLTQRHEAKREERKPETSCSTSPSSSITIEPKSI
jgi:hypothetical protein